MDPSPDPGSAAPPAAPDRPFDAPLDAVSVTPRRGALTELLRELIAPAPPAGDGWMLAPGMVVGRFELIREVGRGGFGVVYEARDRDLGRAVALKALRPRPRGGAAGTALLAEAEAAARLCHPHIVTLHELGRTERGAFLVFELLRGEPLEARLRREGPLPAREAVRIARAVAAALAHAHGRGVVHRDLSARNVFLSEDGYPKVLDLGLAAVLGREPEAGGTPGYMPPEQRRGSPEDARTDVYALGVLLFQMLAGALPGESGGPGPLTGPAPPEVEVAGAPGLGPLLARMLAPDPVDRPADGAAVASALAAVEAELGPPAPDPAPEAPPTVRPRRRLRRWALAALAAAVAAAGAAAGFRLARVVPVAAAGPQVVAVADLANQTGDPELDGLAGFLVTSLEQSRRLAVLTRARMLDIARHMGAPADVAVDEVLGREICRRADASVLITGAIHRIGALYAIELRALDPGRDAYLFTQRETARTKEELLDALDRLSEDARAALREPGEEIAATRIRSRDVVTGDLEAYRRYAVARDDMARLRMAEARAGLERALEADPGFALAHFELVRLGRMSELPPDVRDRHAREARRLEPRLPPRERRTLAAWIAADAGRVGEAEAAYRALATDYPSDAEVARELADLLFRGDRPAEAAPMAARAFSLEPTNLLAGYTLVRSLAWLGRGEEALAAARTARSRAPGPETAIVEAAALGALGRYAEAARAGRDAWTAGDEQGLAALVSASLRGGDLAAVEAEAARLLRRPEPDWRARAHLFLAGVAVARGQRAAALRALAAAEEAGRTGLSYPAYYAERRVQLLAALASPADLDRETALLARLDPWVAADEAAPLAWVGALGPAARAAGGLAAGSAEERSYRAALAHHAGRTAEALPVLRRLAAEHASGSLLEPLFLGELLLARGDAAGAREALSRFVRLEPESGWLAWARPRGQLALARAELALGNAAEARRIADRLAAAWAGADPDYPLAAELRAFQAALPR